MLLTDEPRTVPGDADALIEEARQRTRKRRRRVAVVLLVAAAGFAYLLSGGGGSSSATHSSGWSVRVRSNGAGSLLSQNSTAATLTSFGCATSRKAIFTINAITGNPLIDCAAVWPSATEGGSVAPRLTAWATTTGVPAVLVQPATWGQPNLTSRVLPPATGRTASVASHGRWRRLPADWTVTLGVVELADQLNEALSLTDFPAPPACTYAARATGLVDAFFAADNLHGWHVTVRPIDGSTSPSTACRPVVSNIDANTRAVSLSQVPVETFTHLSSRQARQARRAQRRAALYYKALAALDTRVNNQLRTRCESVTEAASIWQSQASAAGFRPTSPSYFRAVNRPGPAATQARAVNGYTLLEQPASQHTGTCAHILAMPSPGGSLFVYAARIRP